MQTTETKTWNVKLISKRAWKGSVTISGSGITHDWDEKVLFKPSIPHSFRYSWSEVVKIVYLPKRSLRATFTRGLVFEYQFATPVEAAEALDAAERLCPSNRE